MSRMSNILELLFTIVYPFSVDRICSDVPSSLLNIGNLCFLSFCLIIVAGGFTHFDI